MSAGVGNGNRHVQLEIIQQTTPTGLDGGPFEPQENDLTPSIHGRPPAGGDGEAQAAAPEKRLTLFALRLAVLEKMASGLGKIAFVWATVVILGGLVHLIEPEDFWAVTVILVGEGARVFSRSHEIEWQHHSTGTLHGLGRGSLRRLRSSSRYLMRVVRAVLNPVRAIAPEAPGARDIADEQQAEKAREVQQQLARSRKQRAWHPPEVSLLPILSGLFTTTNVSLALSWLQVMSAITCVGLSIYRLAKQDFGEVKEESRNRQAALDLFYGLALAEAATFLLEKAYWSWEVEVRKLLEAVNQESGLGEWGHVSLRRFFYDAYSQCIQGSIFDGIKMDLVTFAQELLHSDFHDEQLIAVRVLAQLVRSTCAGATLRKLGTSSGATERLIEMLEWKSAEEEEIRKCAAEILSRLAEKRKNALRVASIPGSIESISSLLQIKKIKTTAAGEDEDAGMRNYDYSVFNTHGLVILENLARDPDNSWKIGNARGLLPIIIDHTATTKRLLRDAYTPESQIQQVRRALQVVKRLVNTAGSPGKTLRQEVADIVFTMSNLRSILHYGERHIELQQLAIDILNGIAMDEVAKERIATTGGMITLLFAIFCRGGGCTEAGNKLSAEAGETLALLTLEDPKNCDLILRRDDVLPALIRALSEDSLRLNATRILRNLCAYSSNDSSQRLAGVTEALPMVLGVTMQETGRLLEVSIGLTSQICKFMDGGRFAAELRECGIGEAQYVERLVTILHEHKYPDIKVPRIRRHVIQQAIWMMKAEQRWLQLFRDAGIEKRLESVAETTSDLESYHVFSGSAGLSKHRKTVSSIIETAQDLLAGRQVLDDDEF